MFIHLIYIFIHMKLQIMKLMIVFVGTLIKMNFLSSVNRLDL